jgi:ppGpp synthetase/RelA/SpoT-type nucleotidyltranferase
MPFNTALIQPAVERYRRERDRFVKLADRVAEICRTDICEQNALRAQITFRVKTQRSFEGKLKRFSTRQDRNYQSVDEIFQSISDLAGVRIAAYQYGDCQRILDHLRNYFRGPAGDIEIDIKDRHAQDRTNFYRAIHVQVCLPEEELIGVYDNVNDISCEIQICTMIAHVWNEIEHDIGYKGEVGLPSENEKRLLEMLGHTVRAGDDQISMLLEAHAMRAVQEVVASNEDQKQKPFRDIHDFVSRFQDYGDRVMPDFADNSGQLFDIIEEMQINSPAKLEEAIKPFDAQGLIQDIEKFNLALRQEGVPQLSLNEKTSDLILLRLFQAHIDRIVELNRGRFGRGKGRPTRLYRLAVRYQQEKDKKPS